MEKNHCSLSVETEDGKNLSVSTNKDEKCIRLTYGTIGLEWPVLTNVSYHLKDGRNVIGKSPKPSIEDFDESSLRAFQSWITLPRIMEDVKFTKINPEEISWFQIFSTRNKEIVSNKCLLVKDDSEIGYVLSCEKEAVEVSLLVAKSLGERGVYSHHGSFPTLPFEPIGVSSPVPINGKLYPSMKHKYGVNQNGQVIYEKIQ